MKPKKILELEGLRGISALAVVVDHLAQTWKLTTRTDGILGLMFMYGTPAVMVFFLLSGFVIGHTVVEPFSPGAARSYLARRGLRIIPIYWLALLLSFSVARSTILSGAFAVHLLFLQSLLGPIIGSDLPLWSLPFEVAFYLFFLIVWAYPQSWRWAGMISLLAAGIGLVCTSVALNIIALFAVWLTGLYAARTLNATSSTIIEARGRRPMFWVALFLVTSNLHLQPLNAIGGRLHFHSLYTLSLVLNLPLFFDVFLAALDRRLRPSLAWPFYVLCTGLTSLSFAYAVTKPALFREMPEYWSSVILFALAAVSWILRLPNPSLGFWKRCAPLGGISYALYVFHEPSIYFFSRLSIARGRWQLAVCLLVAVVVAVIISIILEKIVQPRINQLFRRRRVFEAPLHPYPPVH